MDAEATAELRRAMILVLASCRTLIDRLDPDDLDQLGMITRVDEVCELIETDLGRLSGRV